MLSGFYGQVSAATTIGGAFWLGGFIAWRENAADGKDPSFDRCENWKKIVARTGKRHMHDTSSQTADSVKPTSLMFFLSAWRLKKNKKKKMKAEIYESYESEGGGRFFAPVQIDSYKHGEI